MATTVHQLGITNTTPGGGSRTAWAPPQQQIPDPRGVLYQLPGQLLQSTAQNYGSMAGGLGGIGQAIGGMAGQQSQSLAGLGNAMAQNYGAYGGALGNIAGAAAQDSAGYYNSLSGAAQANQAGLANMWTQALASLGGLGNTLADSMGRGQVGYQNSLAGMQGANQNAVSQFGQARLNNIGRLGAADAVSGMQFDFGGGGGNQFSATGPDGQIASGSYGGGAGGMGGSGGRTPASMSPYMDAMMDGSVLSQLASSDMDARDRLDGQQDLYRQDYSNLFSQGLLGMLNMGREGAGTLSQGMQDFYGNVGQNRPNFGQYLNAATSGFNDSSRDIRGVGDRMSRDYGSGLGALAGLAGQIGGGMREANDTGMAGVKDMLSRFAPTRQEQARNDYETMMIQRQNRDMLNADAARRNQQYMQSPQSMALGASRLRSEASATPSPQERARLYAMARAREGMARNLRAGA